MAWSLQYLVTMNQAIKKMSKTQRAQDMTGALNAVLMNALDFANTTKVAHWRVEGPHFRQLHVYFDEVVEEVRKQADDIAERIAAMGMIPLGDSHDVARHTLLKPLENQEWDGVALADALSERADVLRDTILYALNSKDKTGTLDRVSEDILVTFLKKVDFIRWNLRRTSKGIHETTSQRPNRTSHSSTESTFETVSN